MEDSNYENNENKKSEAYNEENFNNRNANKFKTHKNSENEEKINNRYENKFNSHKVSDFKEKSRNEVKAITRKDKRGKSRKTIIIHDKIIHSKNKNSDDTKELLFNEFVKVFKKFEKTVITQVIDYSVLYSSSDSCVRYLIDGYTQSNQVYRIAKGKDYSKFTQRNCLR